MKTIEEMTKEVLQEKGDEILKNVLSQLVANQLAQLAMQDKTIQANVQREVGEWIRGRSSDG